jgi:lysophospholipase L1-like esterase
MNRSRFRSVLIVTLLLALALALPQAQSSANGRRIAVFGSSVANGTGDELGKEGYTGRLRTMLAARGWEVLNQSRGGDNTKTMAPRFAPDGAPQPNTRYLLPVNPHYVLLGLSLGNEGIRNGETKAEKDLIFKQFETGMKGFVERSRQHHIVPIVTLCYTRNDFTEVEYEYTRRINLMINAWDVPSVNFLGAIDDGTGKWAKGFWYDSLHPNAAGHDEITMTFVPTLFDALEQGKPLPARSTATGFARNTGGRLTFEPGSVVHPFAFAFTVRAQHSGGVATIAGRTLAAATATKRIDRGARGAVEIESTSLSPASPFTASVGIVNGRWTYTAADRTSVAAADVRADDQWHQVVVSHYTARGETLFYVDGKLAGKIAERLEPSQFTLTGPAGIGGTPFNIDYKDMLVYRSALNGDEVAALHKGTLLQASLEVYAPLADKTFKEGAPVENRAQSLAAVVPTSAIRHVER